MCEYCTQHGEGKKWFLQAKNYSDDLLADLRRTAYIKSFFADQAKLVGRREPLESLELVPPPLRRLVKTIIGRHMAAYHYGQVVSLAEAAAILEMAGTVVRLPCVCRRISLREERRYCFGFAPGPDSLGAAGLVDASYWQGPDGTGLEQLTPAEALRLLAELDRDGLVHSVWTFKTPFIGGLCNCSAKECRAMLATVSYDLPVLHAGESVATYDPAACIGCGACAGRCQFGALHYEREHHRLHLQTEKCRGCGLCASACLAHAIRLIERH